MSVAIDPGSIARDPVLTSIQYLLLRLTNQLKKLFLFGHKKKLKKGSPTHMLVSANYVSGKLESQNSLLG